MAHEAARLVLWSSFYLVNPLNRLLIKDVTTNTVDSIGWIADHPALPKNIDHLVD